MRTEPMFPFREDALREFPTLSAFSEFTDISPGLLSFILRFYDLALRTSKDDYKARMEYLADELELSETEKAIVAGDGRGASPKGMYEYSLAVALFLRLQDNRKWALYTAFEDQFWQNIASIRTPLSPELEDDKREKAIETRAKNREHTSVLREKLEALDVLVWPESENLSATAARNGIEAMTPEKMALLMKGGKP